MSLGTLRRGAGRRPLLARTALSSFLLLFAASLAGCEQGKSYSFVERPEATGGNAGGGGGAGGGTSTPIMLGTPSPFCQLPPTDSPTFGERMLSNDTPARRELFTWTTTEQAQELRAGSVLFTRTEREGLGPGYAMLVLQQLGSMVYPDPVPEPVLLAKLLSGPAFEKARYAWSEPWATRAGWPGETYGDQLVRIVLRKEAWLARYRWGVLDVVDMDNAPVSIADALAQPQRLAGVFFVKDRGSGGPSCDPTFRGGADGYREFVIGNEAMVEEWSIGTPEIRARLESDIALVQTFFERIRPCPPSRDAHSWNVNVVCGWSGLPDVSELGAYQAALAMPSPGYLPSAPSLVALIETLRASLFEPDPFVVTPEQ